MSYFIIPFDRAKQTWYLIDHLDGALKGRMGANSFSHILGIKIASMQNWWGHALRFLPVLAFTVVVLKAARLSDDAYITFRTVDNFVNDNRLTWNLAERLQAYTHPLWMFFLAAGYTLTREIFDTSNQGTMTILR